MENLKNSSVRVSLIQKFLKKKKKLSPILIHEQHNMN